MSVPAVKGLELAHVVAIRGAKGVVVDGPARGVIGVSVTVLLDQTVEEFEKMPRCSQISQCIAQIIVADCVVDQATKPRGCSIGRRVEAASGQAIAGQIVKRGSRPAQRLDQIELVGTGAVVELLVFLLKVIRQLDRQEQLHADAGMPEEFVVEQRPDERAHFAWIAFDLLRLVNAIDEDDDSGITKRVENRLKLA